jgi:hypothetical protein
MVIINVNNNTNNNDNLSRISRRVENLAKEQNIKGAVKLLLQNADRTEEQQQQDPATVFDNIMKGLKTKFPERKEENEFSSISHRVNTIDRGMIIKIVKRLPKNSATAIDGWGRDLLFTAICVDNTIADDLGVILSMLASSTQPNSNKSNEQNIFNLGGKNGKNNNNNKKKTNNNNKSNNDDDSNANNTNQQQQQQNEDDNENNTNNLEEHEFFDNLTMKMFRAARLLGIPKPDGGVRPIILSSFLAKLTGTCLSRRSNIGTIPNQYAINFQNGAKIIGHIARTKLQEGKCLILWDYFNFFPPQNVA